LSHQFGMGQTDLSLLEGWLLAVKELFEALLNQIQVLQAALQNTNTDQDRMQTLANANSLFWMQLQ
jgi:hypothetical protein